MDFDVTPLLTRLEAFSDAFERLAKTHEQRHLATEFNEFVSDTCRILARQQRNDVDRATQTCMRLPGDQERKRRPEIDLER